ncbi:TRAP transporter large permease subunit [Hyphomicrobium sp. CS1BSMeth3]|uniref:TRAP transporter large permease n=1 Tax=Hyphomicrobium sp. CS1BSMeth3 TaxID=1892844 RepID=UPI0009302CD7|nr:TRAP transporter large permease subunit [Hyphomicrobium sp. CS1BSMeth3]
METLAIGIYGIGALLALLAFGVPVAIVLATVGAAGLWFVGGQPLLLTTFRTLPFGVVSDYQFVVLPMFIFMGTLAARTGLVSELYNAAYRWMSRLRGSLYMTTTLASAGFAAISGSTVVNAVVFTRMALPEMLRHGYDPKLSSGCIAAAGTFAALIPPSIIMVVYAVMTGESVGQLLIAGVVPGLLTAGAYVLAIPVLVRLMPDAAPTTLERFSFSERLVSLKPIWAVILLSGVVLGGIYGGLLFPSSAATVGAAGVLLIGLARLRIGWADLRDSLEETASLTGMIFFIIIGGLIFSRFLVNSGVTGEFNDFLTSSGMTKAAFLAVIVVVYLILGCLIDSLSIMIVTMPIVYPLLKPLAIDPIWFGVLIVKLIELSTITPPVGLNLFAVLTAAEGKVSTRQIYIGVLPFVLIELIVLAVLIAFPEISLWLPAQMSGK